MIHERGDGQPDVPAQQRVADSDSPRPCILCLPAHHEADEIAAMMAAHSWPATVLRNPSLLRLRPARWLISSGSTNRTRSAFPRASGRRDACPPPVQAISRPLSRVAPGRGAVERTSRPGEGPSPHRRRRRDTRRRDFGQGPRAGPPIDPAAIAAARSSRTPELGAGLLEEILQ